MNEAAAPIGERLRAERERKGFSTQKAADQLHLDAWVIEALESGDYARIGPPVYGKGHLKRYAGLLGLAADEVIGAYDVRPPPPPVQTVPAAGFPMRAAEPDERAPPWATVSGVAVISLLIAAASVLWFRPWHTARTAAAGAPGALSTAGDAAHSPSSDRSRRPATDDSAVRNGGDRVIDPGALARGVTPGAAGAVTVAAGGTPESPAGAAAERVPGAGHARLRLSFSADSWVDVHDASGRRLFAGRGLANSVKTIAGAAPMKIYLGFASGVQLELNNRVVAIGPQFVAGDVAHFEAGADGVLRQDVHAAAAAGDPRARPRG